MIKPKLYLSGPMTGILNKNFRAFDKAAKKLRKKGYKVISPWDLEVKYPFLDWEMCMKRDIKEQMLCDAIATLPGWKKSKGANLEVHIGKVLKYEIHTVNYWFKKELK